MAFGLAGATDLCFAMLTEARLAIVGAGLVLQGALAAEATLSGPAEIVDGDTLRIGGVGVRLKGISAPERNERGGKAPRDALVR